MTVPECVFEPSLSMFRVLQARGKSFSSGGYGVSLTIPIKVEEGVAIKDETKFCSDNEEEVTGQEDNDVDEIISDNDKPNNIADTSITANHLFVEEALFLQQQGLLNVYRRIEINNKNEKELFSTASLFEIMLQELQVSLPVYLTYAHLRSQSYRVLRHVPLRLKKGVSRVDLRQATRHAPVPQPYNYVHGEDSSFQLAWDVYLPDMHFSKTYPGPPHFSVAVTTFSQPSPTFDELQQILSRLQRNDSAEKLELKLAVVADSGTVVMFGLTHQGVEDISNRNGRQSNDGTEDGNIAR